MEYSNNDFRNYELYHHGILGQKWGRKNGPPYPLDSSDHSAAEKKAGWRKSLDSGGSGKVNYKQQKKQLDQELKDRKKKIQKEYDDEIAKIESKYKNSRSKISDADAAREKAASEKYNKAWDESDRKYKQDLSNLKKETHNDGLSKAGRVAEKVAQNAGISAGTVWGLNKGATLGTIAAGSFAAATGGVGVVAAPVIVSGSTLIGAYVGAKTGSNMVSFAIKTGKKATNAAINKYKDMKLPKENAD